MIGHPKGRSLLVFSEELITYFYSIHFIKDLKPIEETFTEQQQVKYQINMSHFAYA